MLLDSIAISDFPAFSKIDRELAKPLTTLSNFVKWSPSLSTMESIINERKKYSTNRKLLHEVLLDQYKKMSPNPKVSLHIDSILSEKTFTVTTAHQPSLFTGPSFVISKALSVIKLAQQINEHQSTYNIIPFFVIGSEDHDVDELNHTYLFGNKITWHTEQKGPVGRYSLEGIEEILIQVKQQLINTKYGVELIQVLDHAYQPEHSYAEAFQIMLHEVLGHLGIIILNTDDSRFKQQFKPFIQTEVTQSFSKPVVQKTQSELTSRGFEPASYARDINFFYFGNGFRDRIEKNGNIYTIFGKRQKFTAEEMNFELDQHPEHFSPNVIMRPLYQETILPNLAYVGGGGELAYWLERKLQFETLGVPYPMLIRRDSFMIMQQDQFDLLKHFNLRVTDLTTRTDILLNQLAESLSTHPIQLQEESNGIQDWMDRIRVKAELVDKTLGPSIDAEKAKLLKSIEHIEKKLLKAEKLKYEVQLNKVRKLQDKLIPESTLLERRENFMTFYAEHGNKFIQTLLQDFNPLDNLFKVIKI
ncbi:MAG: bacillithiol biosynthesis cysteine-adding enzyme BshC [Saprospiraceae bacterium]